MRNASRQTTRWAIGAFLAIGVIAAGLIVSRSLRHLPVQHPNVILVVLDTLRADRLVAYGATKNLTPFLDRFAEASVVYQWAHAASSWTIPSVASLFLGQYPSEHQVVGYNAILPEHEVTVAEVLRENGYRTAGYSANMQIQAQGGFGQGFEEFELHVGADLVKGDAQQLSNAALDWLESTAGDPRPFLLYLQYMEPHAPYRFHERFTPLPPAGIESDNVLNDSLNRAALDFNIGDREAWRRFGANDRARLVELYDGEVAYLDEHLATFFGELDRRGYLGGTIVAITADHGEEFGEHGVFCHGQSLFEDAIRVPLIVRIPGAAPRRVPSAVELAGLAPALLRYLGIEPPAGFRIAPLPLLDTALAPSVPPYVYSELIRFQPEAILLHERALLNARTKLLVSGTGERTYYDLANDPRETHALTAPPFATELTAALSRVTSRFAAPAGRETAPLDEASRERLRALGYAN